MIEPLQSDDAFVADVEANRSREPSALHLWWLGQSGFLLQYRGRHVLFDPYLSDSLTKKYANTDKPHVRISRRVIEPQRLGFVDVITSTHNHTDHLDAETILPIMEAAAERLAGPLLLVPEANLAFAEQRLGRFGHWLIPINAWDKEEVAPFSFTAVPAAHDQLTIDEHGRNVYLGYVVKAGPWRIYFSGDGVIYDGLAEGVRGLGPIDLAILPINGKVGNMNGADAARLAKDIGAGLVVPCHYDMFEFNTADPAELFVPECERLGQPYRVLRLGERLTLPASQAG